MQFLFLSQFLQRPMNSTKSSGGYSIQGHNLKFTKAIIINFGGHEVFAMYIWMTHYLSQGKIGNIPGIAPCTTNENESVSV